MAIGSAFEPVSVAARPRLARQGTAAPRRSRAILTLALAVAWTLGPASVAALATDWRQFGFNGAHTFNNPYETVLTEANVASLHRAAVLAAPAPGSAPSSPIVVGGRAYFTSTPVSDITAVDATTGSVLWHASPCAMQFCSAGPTYARGAVWVGTSTGRLKAFKASSGKLVFVDRLSGAVRTPTVSGSTIFVTDSTGDIEAVDAATRTVLWRRAGGTTLPSTDSPGMFAAKNGVLYTIGSSGSVYAVDATTGGLVFGPIAVNATRGTPAVAAGRVFLSYTTPDLDTGVVALDASTGAVLWTVSFPTLGQSGTQLALADGLVLGSLEEPAGLWALRQRDGSIAWTQGAPEGALALTVANDLLYATSDIDEYLEIVEVSTGAVVPGPIPVGEQRFDTIGPVVNGSLYVRTFGPCADSSCYQLERWST